MATIVAGYAITWADRAQIDDHFERFERGCFQHQISTSLRVAHDTRPGAVIMWAMPVCEDAEGLHFCAALDGANPDHRAIINAMRSGMNAVSFSFRPVRVRWEGDTEVIERAQLKEMSLLGAGAYPQSRAWLVE